MYRRVFVQSVAASATWCAGSRHATCNTHSALWCADLQVRSCSSGPRAFSSLMLMSAKDARGPEDEEHERTWRSELRSSPPVMRR
jgi:hypothetical protein